MVVVTRVGVVVLPGTVVVGGPVVEAEKIFGAHTYSKYTVKYTSVSKSNKQLSSAENCAVFAV